jgi:hypothetical protein
MKLSMENVIRKGGISELESFMKGHVLDDSAGEAAAQPRLR